MSHSQDEKDAILKEAADRGETIYRSAKAIADAVGRTTGIVYGRREQLDDLGGRVNLHGDGWAVPQSILRDAGLLDDDFRPYQVMYSDHPGTMAEGDIYSSDGSPSVLRVVEDDLLPLIADLGREVATLREQVAALREQVAAQASIQETIRTNLAQTIKVQDNSANAMTQATTILGQASGMMGQATKIALVFFGQNGDLPRPA